MQAQHGAGRIRATAVHLDQASAQPRQQGGCLEEGGAKVQGQRLPESRAIAEGGGDTAAAAGAVARLRRYCEYSNARALRVYPP